MRLKIIAALFIFGFVHSQEEGPDSDEPKYIPENLADAVRVLTGELNPEDQKKIKSGEFDNLHFSLGMGLRNGWGLWAGSRLSVYFQKNGIIHPDTMSGYIIAAFKRSLRGETYDLLEMIQEEDREYPQFHYPIITGRIIDRERRQAILYERKDYDENGYIRSTKLLWHPDDGEIYLKSGDVKLSLVSDSQFREFESDTSHWMFSREDIKLLEELRGLSKDGRREKIENLDPELRKKIDGILPRTESDEAPQNYFFDFYAKEEAAKVSSDQVLMQYTMPACEFAETPLIYVVNFMRQKATEALRQRTYRFNQCVMFEVNYDPDLIPLETLVNYKEDNELTLEKMFTEVLQQVNLSYSVVSDTEIRIFHENEPENKARKVLEPVLDKDLMDYISPRVSIAGYSYILVEYYLRLKAKESLNRFPEFSDDFVVFNLQYDPGLLSESNVPIDNAPINFKAENVTLGTLFTDVLGQVGLSYRVVSENEIDIFQKKDR